MPIQPKPKRRNLAAMSPLLRKGGVHEKSKSSQRASDKQQLNAELIDWREELEEDLYSLNHSRFDAGNDFVIFAQGYFRCL